MVVMPASAHTEYPKSVRCHDCGEHGVRTGHIGCQYPQDRVDAHDSSVDPYGCWGAP